MKYLLDTNTVSFYLRGDEGVVKRIQKTKPSELAISSTTVMELTYGVVKRHSDKLTQLVDTFVDGVTVISLDESCAREAGIIRAMMEKKGQQISLADSQIAGTARIQKLTVVSSDAVFKKVPTLKTADWNN